MKKLLLLVLLILGLCLNACEVPEQSVEAQTASQQTDVFVPKLVDVTAVFTYFNEIAQSPLASDNEQTVGDYLLAKITAMGYQPQRDENNNIIVNKPATAGYEGKSLTVIQAHTDMLAVTKQGFNAALGTDNGVGVAMSLYILQSAELEHGPLRLILTNNKENSMTGAIGLDASYLADASSLINLNGENSGQITLGSPDSSDYVLSDTPHAVKPKLEQAVKISLTEGNGGHSGLDINKGRLNAICALAQLTGQINVPFELAQFTGGAASDSIPCQAHLTLVIDKQNLAELKLLIDDFGRQLRQAYIADNQFKLKIKETDLPETVIAKRDADKLFDLLQLLPNGLNTMMLGQSDTVESSSNLGKIAASTERVFINIMQRSNNSYQTTDQHNKLELLANRCGFSADLTVEQPRWQYKANNKTAALYQKVYQQTLQKQMEVYIPHNTLECAYFYQKNSDLQMISVGAAIDNTNLEQEQQEQASISQTLTVISKTLKELD